MLALEGGYDPEVLSECVEQAVGALKNEGGKGSGKGTQDVEMTAALRTLDGTR